MTELHALQSALAAEYAAVYGYGVVGSVMRDADREYATKALEAHMLQRDRLIALVTDLHGRPVASQPAYALPAPVTDRTSARDLAAHLEEGSAGTLWDLVGASAAGGHLRALAISWLSAAAIRAAHWGAQQALPGQPS